MHSDLIALERLIDRLYTDERVRKDCGQPAELTVVVTNVDVLFGIADPRVLSLHPEVFAFKRAHIEGLLGLDMDEHRARLFKEVDGAYEAAVAIFKNDCIPAIERLRSGG